MRSPFRAAVARAAHALPERDCESRSGSARVAIDGGAKPIAPTLRLPALHRPLTEVGWGGVGAAEIIPPRKECGRSAI